MFNPKENILDQQLAESGLELNILGGIKDFFTGGASTRNAYARKQADATNRYQKKLYKFEGKELERRYNYAVDSLDILKANDRANLQYRQDSLQQDWNYGMAIRDYQYSQDLKAYQQSRVQAAQQIGFNAIAERFANLQQDRFMMEQQLNLQFDENETMLAYAAAQHGLSLKKQKAKSGAAREMRELGIAEIKGKGASAAMGQAGRTAAKNLNATMMEARAKEADIINTLLYDTQQVDMELLVNAQQKLQDDLAFDLTEQNLVSADTFTRLNIEIDRAQNDFDALARVLQKPDIAPPLPKPLALPIPVYQDVYKDKQGPKPMENVPFQENLGSAFVNTAIGLVSTGLGIAGGVKTLTGR